VKVELCKRRYILNEFCKEHTGLTMAIEQKESLDKDTQRQNYYRACMNQFQTLGYLDNIDQFNRKDNQSKTVSLSIPAHPVPPAKE
jgi:hypothetical protein